MNICQWYNTELHSFQKNTPYISQWYNSQLYSVQKKHTLSETGKLKGKDGNEHIDHANSSQKKAGMPILITRK